MDKFYIYVLHQVIVVENKNTKYSIVCIYNTPVSTPFSGFNFHCLILFAPYLFLSFYLYFPVFFCSAFNIIGKLRIKINFS